MKKICLLLAVIFFALSCQNHFGHVKNPPDPRFKQIDRKLTDLAKLMGTNISAEVGGASFDSVSVPTNKLDSRLVMWKDGLIRKGVMINQNFENKNMDAPDWDFLILAVLDDDVKYTNGRPFWQKYLLKKVSLDSIDRNLDVLLKRSVEKLSTIKRSDLSYDSNQDD